jgi:hypothetical protein
MDTTFKQNLIEKLEKKDLSPNSIKTYVRALEILNNKQPLKNLTFLNDIDAIKDKIKDYSPNSQRNFIIAISTSLNTGDKKPKIYESYFNLLKEMNTKLKSEESKNVKTDKQLLNWIEYNDMQKKLLVLKDKVDDFKNEKGISPSQYDILLQYLVLSLYMMIPPRRNKDFLEMDIINNPEDMEDNQNYLLLSPKGYKFIFGNYKTSKKMGKQTVDIPDDLKKVIDTYLKIRGIKKTEKDLYTPFLVTYGDQAFLNNGITKVLNKAFDGKKVSSSMIRHAYLSDKYGDIQNEMKKDAEALGHSTNVQKDYIKM